MPEFVLEAFLGGLDECLEGEHVQADTLLEREEAEKSR
jgi:hypothetical protein